MFLVQEETIVRIFLVLHPSSNLSVPNSLTWFRNLYEPLVELGHDVFLFRLDNYCTSNNIKFRSQKYKERLSSDLIEIFKKENSKKNFNIFFSYLTENDIYPAAIDEIKKNSTPTLNFSCNNIHQFSLVESIAKYFDFNLHSEKEAAKKFQNIGANPVWFQMASNPKYYFPIKSVFKYDVSFLGSNYARRSEYILYLLENNISVNCFGPNWLINKPFPQLKSIKKEILLYNLTLKKIFSPDPAAREKHIDKIKLLKRNKYLRRKYFSHMHRPIPDERINRLFNESRINLGFLEVITNPDYGIIEQHIHLREFEVPMAGGLYITNYSEELAEFYEPDKEILMYSTLEEFIDKIKFYLSHSEEADKVRSAGYQRAIHCHSYQKRFSNLFMELGLNT